MERKEILLIVLIAVLVLTTAVQAIQLMALSNNPVVVTSGSSPAQGTGSGSPGVAASGSLEDLPSMVGGC
ncbi:hypothetical protein HYU50_04015 [Candidatus Woesearchaeota archaeon]|nr:hypothetical protein [Candidatus Woesearchaeota archaeon]